MESNAGLSKREMANQELEEMAYRLESRVHSEVVFSKHSRECFEASKQNFQAFHECNQPSLSRLKKTFERQVATQHYINSKMSDCFSAPKADCVDVIRSVAGNVENFLLK